VLQLHSRTIEPISKQLTIVIGLTVVGFMAFGLALSFYRNILFEQTLADLELQNNAIQDQIRTGEQNLEYFHSEQFKDKYAKENLGKLNPGEKVIIITQAPDNSLFSAENNKEEQERREAAYFELLRQMPVIEHWKLYLFQRDKMEEIKKAL
jgi:cell division protein FtsB